MESCLIESTHNSTHRFARGVGCFDCHLAKPIGPIFIDFAGDADLIVDLPVKAKPFWRLIHAQP